MDKQKYNLNYINNKIKKLENNPIIMSLEKKIPYGLKMWILSTLVLVLCALIQGPAYKRGFIVQTTTGPLFI